MRARIVIAIALLLVSCSAEKSDWQATQSADTVEAYQQFIGKHPQSAMVSEARERTKQLSEEKDWEKATGIDTADSYQAFVSKYPEGKWSEEARIRIENFNVLGAPATAAPIAAAAPKAVGETAEPAKPANAGSAVVAAPKSATPAPTPKAAPKPVPAAVPKPAATGGYRVQLGALSSEDKANKEWQRLKGKYASQLTGLAPSVVPVNAPAGKLYRLQASVADEARARATCAALAAVGQACVVVKPK